MNKIRTRTIVIWMAVIVGYLVVGTMEFDDEVRLESLYCKMVEAGKWPPFKDDVSCPEAK